jgi:hypothetical protein
VHNLLYKTQVFYKMLQFPYVRCSRYKPLGTTPPLEAHTYFSHARNSTFVTQKRVSLPYLHKSRTSLYSDPSKTNLLLPLILP